MAIRSLRAGRQNYPPETYVGTLGEVFYNEATGEFRRCDAVTPGGFPIPLVVASQTVAGTIKLGPGVTTNAEGQIIIDSEGLDFSFGDFASSIGTYTDTTDYAVLQTINLNEDAVIASNGTGSVHVVGEFKVHPTNGDLTSTLEDPPAFTIQADGQIKIRVPSIDPLVGAVSIIGSVTGNSLSPAVAGVMLHITGNNNEFATVYADGINNFSNYIGRRYNGTTAAPTQVKAGNVVCRFSGSGYGTTTFPAGASASVSIVALEDYTDSQQGTKIEFLTAPIGSLTRQLVATISVADGITATKFTGPLIGTATTATNLAAATGILTGTLSIDPANIVKETASEQTFTLTGLTTNHKIVITSGTALGYGVIISAAWASALNTLSIEFQNFSNGAIDLPAKNIQYFAWV